MAKFCGKCGGKLDDVTGKCPNCDKATPSTPVKPQTNNNQQNSIANNDKTTTPKKKQTRKEIRAAKKAEKKANMTIGQKIKRFFVKLIAIILALVIIIGAGLCTLVYFDKLDIPIIEKAFEMFGISDDKGFDERLEEIKEIDVGEEIRQESRILETIEANKSTQVMSEKDVFNEFEKRGFNELQITTTYSMEGNYYSEKNIANNSEEKHPLYSATYKSVDGYCWTIYCCNGEWSAIPLSYIYSGKANSEIIVSETEYVMSYDSFTNSFYKIIPNENQCTVKRISNINSTTLDDLARKEFSVL